MAKKTEFDASGRRVVTRWGFIPDEERGLDWTMLYTPVAARTGEPFNRKPCSVAGCSGMTFTRSSGPFCGPHAKADRLNGAPGRGVDGRSALARDMDELGLRSNGIEARLRERHDKRIGNATTPIDDNADHGAEVIDLEAAREALGGSLGTAEKAQGSVERQPMPAPLQALLDAI